jgi:hypothetical protein
MSGKIVTRVNSEGHVLEYYRAGPNPQWQEGTVDGITTVYVDQSESSISNLNFWVDTHYYKDGEWKERSKPTGDFYDWKDEAWVANTTIIYEKIRRERRTRLYQSDWTQFVDSPLSDEKKAEWAAYRQALRNLPQSQPNLDDPAQVVWPDEPS